jgi:hypothetical protein
MEGISLPWKGWLFFAFSPHPKVREKAEDNREQNKK